MYMQRLSMPLDEKNVIKKIANRLGVTMVRVVRIMANRDFDYYMCRALNCDVVSKRGDLGDGCEAHPEFDLE